MKKHLLPLFLLSATLGAVAQEPSAPKKPAAEEGKSAAPQQLKPYVEAFTNLPQERRDQYLKHMAEADRLFKDKRVFETLDELAKADLIFKDNPEALNVLGSCYVEFRDFDKALDAYQRALKLDPENQNIKFNVGEVYFVTKKWKECLSVFEEILKATKAQANITALGRIIEFKILLCKIKLGQKEEVEILAEKYDYLDDSPYYYFAKAALAYNKGDLVKAEEWLAIAGRIFQDPNALSAWQDTLVEFGYIKSFYGDDIPTPAP